MQKCICFLWVGAHHLPLVVTVLIMTSLSCEGECSSYLSILYFCILLHVNKTILHHVLSEFAS